MPCAPSYEISTNQALSPDSPPTSDVTAGNRSPGSAPEPNFAVVVVINQKDRRTPDPLATLMIRTLAWGCSMPFVVIGQEWARSLNLAAQNQNTAVDDVIREAQAIRSPEELRAFVRDRQVDLYLHWARLLGVARSEVLAGRDDVEWIGQALIAIGHLSPEAQAAGYFLVGYALRWKIDQSGRYFGRASVAYRDLRSPLPAALSTLAAAISEIDPIQLRDGADVDGLRQAVAQVKSADSGCGRRISDAVENHIALVQVARELMAGGRIPSLRFPVSEDGLTVLRAAMVGALPRPGHAAAIARWIQRLRGLPGDATQELDMLVNMLGDVRDWHPRLALLRDMTAKGDQRDETLVELARTLHELGHWDEAKAELKARLLVRTGQERVELLKTTVMMGFRAGDLETPAWVRALDAAGGESPLAMPPPSQMEEELKSILPKRRLFARYENGTLTVDPSIPPGEVQEHIMAAVILGLGPDEGAAFRDDLQVKDLDLHAKVLELLPAQARPLSAEQKHLVEAERFFRQGHYQDAIKEFQAALAMEPDLETGHFGLGSTYFMLGKYSLAIAHFRESIAIRPTPQAWRLLGDAILKDKHDLPQAKRCYEQALALDPHYRGAQDMLQYVSDHEQ
ncbi:tetratricopeptide repeat protein [Nonomuraea sp. NPDC049400]|uniref:tetratricopeptide repeat protein n=1 Tax=Nonomuraea sp. NPDC049400 TaxID=3364352 RepID=UPI003792FA1E